jgi:hypothetical protein
MSNAKPDEKDFVIEGSKVTHAPTGAWFTYYRGEGGFSNAASFIGNADRPRPGEVEYSFDELESMAATIFKSKYYPLLGHALDTKKL